MTWPNLTQTNLTQLSLVSCAQWSLSHWLDVEWEEIQRGFHWTETALFPPLTMLGFTIEDRRVIFSYHSQRIKSRGARAARKEKKHFRWLEFLSFRNVLSATICGAACFGRVSEFPFFFLFHNDSQEPLRRWTTLSSDQEAARRPAYTKA